MGIPVLRKDCNVGTNIDELLLSDEERDSEENTLNKSLSELLQNKPKQYNCKVESVAKSYLKIPNFTTEDLNEKVKDEKIIKLNQQLKKKDVSINDLSDQLKQSEYIIAQIKMKLVRRKELLEQKLSCLSMSVDKKYLKSDKLNQYIRRGSGTK